MEGIAVRAETYFSAGAGKGIWTRERKRPVSKTSVEILVSRKWLPIKGEVSSSGEGS